MLLSCVGVPRALLPVQFLASFLGEMMLAPQRTAVADAMDHIMVTHASSMSATQVRSACSFVLGMSKTLTPLWGHPALAPPEV